VYVRRDGAVFAQPFDLDALELRDGAIPLFEGVRTSGSGADMRLAPDGGLLYVEGGIRQNDALLAVVGLEGNQDTLSLGVRSYGGLGGPGWSPDRESVAYVSEGNVYTYNTVLNTTPRQITFEGNNAALVFSPDGTRLAFGSVLEGVTNSADILVKDLESDDPPEPIASLEGFDLPSQWRNDTIIFGKGPQPGDLWYLDLSDPDAPEERLYLPSEADLGPMLVSPDGTLAAYGSDETGTDEVYIRTFPVAGAPTVVSVGGGQLVGWSPDGTTLYYFTGYNGRPNSPLTMVAARLRLDPTPDVVSTDTLFTVQGVAIRPSIHSLHPDGDRFVLAISDQSSMEDLTAAPERVIHVQNWFAELRAALGEN
jgi:WD40 repeat protein